MVVVVVVSHELQHLILMNSWVYKHVKAMEQLPPLWTQITETSISHQIIS